VTSTLSVSSSSSSSTLTYAGAVSCAGGVGEKTVDVIPQVYNDARGYARWFTLGDGGIYQGPTPLNPLRRSATGAAGRGHVYRILVYGRVTLADRRASSALVCAGCVATLPYYMGTLPDLRVSVPGIFDAPQNTAPAPSTACSVTETGPNFPIVTGMWVMSYSGELNCPPNVSHQALTICAQTSRLRHGKAAWVTITGSCLSQGPSTLGSLVLSTGRSVYVGHQYRVSASATIRYSIPNGTVTSWATAYSSGSRP
jgi:hypothetical protein